MRFNDKEIALKASGSVELEGCLHYLRPQGNDWSNWYTAPTFKERLFRLTSNLLFYYRVGDLEPMGVFVLENATVKLEKPFNGAVFAFSLEYPDEPQRKHLFSCRNMEEAQKWVSVLSKASYEYLRAQYHILQKKISMKKGENPALNTTDIEHLEWPKNKSNLTQHKPTFQSHIGNDFFNNSPTEQSTKKKNNGRSDVSLIEF